MAAPRKILIADPDVESVRALSRELRQRGYQVHYAQDGSKALELAVLRHPDLTLFDESSTLLDARTFTNILRTNPRTAEIPVVLTGATFDPDRFRGWRDGFLRKPFNTDEVLARIDQIFRRAGAEAARELKGQREIEGNLSQLSLFDLMQILSMNKRTGRLLLQRGAERGEVHAAHGRPVNARERAVDGRRAAGGGAADGRDGAAAGAAAAAQRVPPGVAGRGAADGSAPGGGAGAGAAAPAAGAVGGAGPGAADGPGRALGAVHADAEGRGAGGGGEGPGGGGAAAGAGGDPRAADAHLPGAGVGAVGGGEGVRLRARAGGVEAAAVGAAGGGAGV